MSPAGASSDPKEERSRDRSRVSKYQCPADFVSCKYRFSADDLLDTSDHTELWLIKAPPCFDPKSFAGLKVPLSGLQMIQSSDETPLTYSILGGGAGPTDLRVLTSSSINGQDVCLSASGFTGLLSISESYGNCSGNQGPIAIPAAPAPSIPPGLKQRFQPFGSSTPPHRAEGTISASSSSSKRARLDLEKGEEKRRKKKNKRKEKHSQEESSEMVPVKQEALSGEYDELATPEPAEGMVERRKKKKVKKEKDRGDRQDELATHVNSVLKDEPMDTSYGDMHSPAKKKKKKKRTVDE